MVYEQSLTFLVTSGKGSKLGGIVSSEVTEIEKEQLVWFTPSLTVHSITSPSNNSTPSSVLD